MSKAKVFIVLIIFAVTSILTACVGDRSSTEEGTKELEFFHRFTESPDKEYFEGAVERFEEEHDDIKIKISSAVNEDYKQKINVRMSNEEPPDIFFTWAGEYSDKFSRNSRALNLSEYLDKDSNLEEQIIDTQLEPYKYDNNIYGIPIVMDGKAFFYNKDVFDDLGLDEPDTWDEFLDVLRELKDEEITPISFGNQDDWAAGHYLTTLNQRMVDPDTLEKDYNPDAESEFSDPGYEEALDKLLDLDPYFTDDPNAVTDDQAINAFVNGEAAIYYNQFNQYPFIEEAEHDIGWFNFPKIEDGKGNQEALTGSPQGFMVSSNTDYPDEAIEFLEFLTSPEEAQKMVDETGMISSSIDGIPNEENEVLKKFVETIEDASEINIWLDSAMDSELASIYQKEAQKMLGGEESPDEVMEKIQNEAKKK